MRRNRVLATICEHQDQPHYAFGVCKRCYERKFSRRKRPCPQCGNPCKPRVRMCLACWRASREDRFWAKVKKTNSCWLWMGGRDIEGYGRFSHGQAHRVAWELSRGPISTGLVVCHHCDTPACVNPDHLFVGTQRDNRLDCVRKGRQGKGPAFARGENNIFAKLSDDHVRAIRLLRSCGWKVSRLSKMFNVSGNHVFNICSRKARRSA